MPAKPKAKGKAKPVTRAKPARAAAPKPKRSASRAAPKPAEAARHADYERHLRVAEHEHQDPRAAGAGPGMAPGRAHRDPRKEYGSAKDRMGSRVKPMTNWFRQAPRQKGQ